MPSYNARGISGHEPPGAGQGWERVGPRFKGELFQPRLSLAFLGHQAGQADCRGSIRAGQGELAQKGRAQ